MTAVSTTRWTGRRTPASGQRRPTDGCGIRRGPIPDNANLSIRSSWIDDAGVTSLTQILRPLISTYDRLRRDKDIPDYTLDIVFSDDFAAEVDATERILTPDASPYNTDRISGVAVAKTLPLSADWSAIRIIFNAAAGDWSSTEHLVGLSSLAHELAHPLLDRLAHMIGRRPMEAMATFRMRAEEIGKIAMDEYRADRIGAVVGRALAPETFGHVPAYGIAMAASAVDVAHPHWPDTVQSYRERRMDLTAMASELLVSFGDVVRLLADAQAEIDSRSRNGTEGNVLDHEAIASLRGAQLYLGPLRPFFDELRSSMILPPIAEARALENRLTRLSLAGVLEMSRQLGLDVGKDRADGSYSLFVRAPQR